MSDTTSTLKLSAQAELGALDKWIAKVREAKVAVAELAGAAQSLTGTTGGSTGGGNSATGSPPPSPPPPPAPSGAPTAPGAPAGQQGRGVAPASPSAATGALGGPPQAPPGFHVTNYRTNAAGQITGANFAPGPPPNPGGSGTHSGGPPSFVDRAAGFARNVLGTAAGVALGGSLQGFLFQSAETYMRLSTVIAQLDARFRDAGTSAAFFGAKLGYTAQQGGQFVSTYGAVLNNFNERRASDILGAARLRGMDPNQAIQTVATMQQLMPSRGVGMERTLQRLLGGAEQANMGQGRLPEYLSSVLQIQEMMLRSGNIGGGLGNAQALSTLPSLVFGADDPRSKGAMGVEMLQGLQGMSQTQPMRSFLLRQMGFGRPGGPTFRQAMVQTEKGLLDPQNLRMMLEGLDKQGIGRDPEAIFAALHSLRGSMSAGTVSSLSEMFADTGRREQFFGAFGAGANTEREKAFLASLSKEEREAFEKAGFVGAGKLHVSQGEGMAVRLEAMQMEFGKTVATTIDDLRGIAHDLLRSLKNLIGDDLGKMLHDGLMGVKQLTSAIEHLSGVFAGGMPGNGGVAGIVGGIGATAGVTSQLGPSAGARYFFANAPQAPSQMFLWNMAVNAARAGPEGQYMQDLGAWVRGEGAFPGPHTPSQGTGGSGP